MTKLSDALRGAADRAPVGSGGVSADEAKRRVTRQRALRGTGNVLAGAGAVAVIALGVMAPGAASGGASADDAAGTSFAAPEADAKLAAGSEAYDGGFLGCGSSFWAADPFPTDGAIAVNWDGGEVEGGTNLDLPVTVTGPSSSSVALGRPTAYVLYQGTVVAVTGATTDDALIVDAGADADWSTGIELVNCWDGNPLPAADYDLVVTGAFTPIDVAGEPEPAPAEPSTEPSEAATSEMVDDVVTPDVARTDVSGGTAVSATVAFSVAGDRVDNPFADYIGEPWTPPAAPEGTLTPAEARALYEAAATDNTWDFAPGTSRWIVPNWGEWDEATQKSVGESWFGCSYDGSAGLTFPTNSAQLDLLKVTAKVPSSIHTSYGYVVDGNPTVDLTITNTSDYTFTGFSGEPNAQFYLVKDGRVVAEWYPVSTNPYGGQVLAAKAESSISATSTLIAPNPDYWGEFAAGDSQSATLLWRDLNGCWTDAGPSAVEPGTYTVVSMRNLYFEDYSAGYPVTYDQPIAVEGDGGIGDSGDAGDAGGAAVDSVAVAPAPDGEYSWFEMQLWTSHGTVTVSAS